MTVRKIDRLDAWMRRNRLTDAALTREVGLSNGLLNKSRSAEIEAIKNALLEYNRLRGDDVAERGSRRKRRKNI